jgi:hypothetical protein
MHPIDNDRALARVACIYACGYVVKYELETKRSKHSKAVRDFKKFQADLNCIVCILCQLMKGYNRTDETEPTIGQRARIDR